VAAVAVETPEIVARARRTILWAEFVVVMVFAALPTMIAGRDSVSFFYSTSISVFETYALFTKAAILLFVVWVADGTFSAIGISKPRVNQDIALFFGLFASAVLLGLILFLCFPSVALLPGVRYFPKTPLWASLLVTVASMSYDVLKRGYIVGRLVELCGNRWLPIVACATIMSVHGWFLSPTEGVGELLLGLVLAATIAYSKRIWAPLAFVVIAQSMGVIDIYLRARG
jgi:hypothetical protein